jgi:hypothetical protein
VNLAAAALVAFTLGAGGADAGEHLLAGATAFREARYQDALVEYRVAERLGAAEARPYAAAALVKLGRPEEALEAFGADAARDSLLDYYRALALYGARLYLSADAVLADVGERAGPRIAAHVAELRARIAAALPGEPPRAAIDEDLARCAALRAEGRAALATAYCREAAALAARRRDRHRLDEASRALTLAQGEPAATERR